jgi:thiamine-phosphate pyrophosphorylase
MPDLKKPALRGLYAITPDGIDKETLLSRVEAALRGGASIVQYRDKQRDAVARSEIARAKCAMPALRRRLHRQ